MTATFLLHSTIFFVLFRLFPQDVSVPVLYHVEFPFQWLSLETQDAYPMFGYSLEQLTRLKLCLLPFSVAYLLFVGVCPLKTWQNSLSFDCSAPLGLFPFMPKPYMLQRITHYSQPENSIQLIIASSLLLATKQLGIFLSHFAWCPWPEKTNAFDSVLRSVWRCQNGRLIHHHNQVCYFLIKSGVYVWAYDIEINMLCLCIGHKLMSREGAIVWMSGCRS